MSGQKPQLLKLKPTQMQSQAKVSKTTDFSNQNFFNGIDAHAKQWTITTRCDGTYIKTYSMPPSPQILAKHLETNYPNGNYFSVYEAGFLRHILSRRTLCSWNKKYHY